MQHDQVYHYSGSLETTYQLLVGHTPHSERPSRGCFPTPTVTAKLRAVFKLIVGKGSCSNMCTTVPPSGSSSSVGHLQRRFVGAPVTSSSFVGHCLGPGDNNYTDAKLTNYPPHLHSYVLPPTGQVLLSREDILLPGITIWLVGGSATK